MRFTTWTDVPDLDMDGGRLNHPLRSVRISRKEDIPWLKMRQKLHPYGRLEHRVLGHVDSPNGGDACWDKAQKGCATCSRSGWDQGIGYEVADAGRIQFAISPIDLRHGRFDRSAASSTRASCSGGSACGALDAR